jgi:CBS domain-containing protein
MGTAQNLIRDRLERGERVVTIDQGATVYEAARVMNDHRIGALVVTDDGDGVVGIFTERDLLKRVVAEGLRPDDTLVGAVMTRDVIVCTPDTLDDDIRLIMRTKRIRHVPVVDAGRLIGMISIGDLNVAETKTLTETISYLEQYMTRL